MSPLFPALLLAFAAGGGAPPAGPPVSGPQVGDKVPGPFEPLNVTGPNAGEPCCLYCKFGHRPVAMVFARTPTEPLARLIRKLDAACAEHPDLAGFVVFCNDDPGLPAALRKLADRDDHRHVVLAVTGPAGPDGYAVHKDADVTVVLYTLLNVKANHAFRKGGFDDKAAEAVLADLPLILPAK
ncbi:MAG TPA: hypothetical protein VIL46_02100 [Gemmataceae bacterium]